MFGNLTALQNLYKRVVLDAAQPHRLIYRCLQCLDALLVECWTNWKDWIVQPKITSLCLIELNTIRFKTECFCFSSQQLSAVSSCLDTWTFLNFQRQKKTPHTSLFFLFFVFHPHSPHLLLGSFGAGWVPKSQKSGGCSATSTSVIMSCLAFQGRVSRNVCACLCLSFLVFHTCAVCFSVSTMQNQPLKIQWRLQECSH